MLQVDTSRSAGARGGVHDARRQVSRASFFDDAATGPGGWARIDSPVDFRGKLPTATTHLLDDFGGI